MADIQSLRRQAEAARAIAGDMGLRRHRVYTLVREWSGTHVGDGASSDTEEELLESGYPPKVRALTGEELAINGLGSYVYEVGPFTPTYSESGITGGVEYSTLVPEAKGQCFERLYRIIGEEFGEQGKLFALAENPGIKAFSYRLRLKPIESLES